MSTVDDLRHALSHIKEDFTSAIQSFRSKADQAEQDAMYQLLEHNHKQLVAALKGNSSAIIDDPILIWGHTLLDKATEDAVDLVQDKAIVHANGTLLGTGKYETLDPGWTLSFIKYLEYKDNKAPFGTNPPTIDIGNQVNLALIGDWGTGYYYKKKEDTPAAKVAAQVQAIQPDYTIHLGDVYYAGTKEEEQENLVDIWPKGHLGQFSLNSNHEMYCGGKFYFEEALGKLFTAQNGTSYFALKNDSWLILNLDTAYLATDLYLDGALGTDNPQTQWLGEMAKTAGNRKIMVISHHLPYDLQGNTARTSYDQFKASFGRAPDYWYWGHAHNAVVYKPFVDGMIGRCIGHGAVPYGNATELEGQPMVEWYETTSANDPESPVRVQCGFAQVILDGAQLSERLIGEDGSTRWSSENFPTSA